MLSIDDRTGNMLTTVTIFGVAAAVLYLARGSFFILLLSLMFAYLLEPAVTLVQQRSRLGKGNRTFAIAQVYLLGLLVLGGLGYEVGPRVVEQLKSLHAALPLVLRDLTEGNFAADLQAKYGLTLAQQEGLHGWLARNADSITRVFERGAASAAYIAESAIWLLAVPILAIFILGDGRQSVDAMIQAVARRRDPTLAKRIVGQIDVMLAKYVRAQLAMSGLSLVFYVVAMLLLRFPYAIALGVLGAALEFLPVVGWIASAGVILTIGFLTHAHWIWMAGLVVLWRLVQNYVNSPRVMGDSLQLQPLTVLFSLMVGGQVAGIAGVYLAVPVAAVMRILWTAYFSPGSSPNADSHQPLLEVKAMDSITVLPRVAAHNQES